MSLTRATLDDLYRTPGKAELIGGKIVEYVAAGNMPSQVAGNIYASLRERVRKSGRGVPHMGKMGFAIPELPSGRESFSPDASYYDGPLPANRMRFIQGPPTFAAEVRNESDYGAAAEEAMTEKRADYFAAGTLVVWDVDPKGERVHVYRRTDPNRPMTYVRGQAAEAEPAVPGWRMPVDDVFWLAPGST